MSVLVLAPHSDDETLCCGGTIAKFIEAGREVFIYAFSCGTSNASEFKGACRVLKAEPTVLNFHTRNFTDARQQILEKLIDIRKALKPAIILLPASSDVHQDHQVIHDEGKRAFKHNTIYGYEACWNSFGFKNDCYVTLSPEHMVSKVAAMQEYVSQFGRSYFKEESIISLARMRGMQAGCEYAECFQVIRQFL